MNNIVGQDTQSLQVALISTKQEQIYLECGKKEACKMNKIDKLNKLKSLKVTKWRKDEWTMMKDDDFKLLRGFDNGQTDGQIYDCRVPFATEKQA